MPRRVGDNTLNGAFLSNILQPNLGTDPGVFKNKNVEVRKQVLKRKELPRRDSEENLSFWTRTVVRKFTEQAETK